MSLTTSPPRSSSGAVRSVTIQEYGRATVSCSADVAAQIHSDGHVTVAPLAGGSYELRARHKVGVLRYGDLEVRIVPKVKVGRLLYLASYHDDPESWRQVDTLLDEATDPLSAIAQALIFHSRLALSPTPLQGYVTHESAERRVRGRVLFDRQLSRRAGALLPVELRYDEYELGIAENRVLKAALTTIERFVADPGLQSQLRHLRSQLDGVVSWPAGHRIPEFVFTRLNQRYKPALALARLVLERRSLEYPEARRTGTAFLFNMNRVFEAYLEKALERELERFGGRVESQFATHLDESRTLRMKPDITWWQRGMCRAVFDAKYKRTSNSEYPNADAYQMLAYCTRLGLDRGYLVYADLDGTAPSATTVRNAGIEIVATSVDLSGSIADLERTVSNIAQSALDGCGLSGASQ